MPTELPVRVVQDPSRQFTRLPGLHTAPPDVIVSFDVCAGDRIRARLYGPGVPALKGTEHKADLVARPGEVRAAAARLCAAWQELFVGHRSLGPDGMPDPDRPEYPYTRLVDLSEQPRPELDAILDELAFMGADLLFGVLLGGDGRRTELIRTYLTDALGEEGLRIRFDSDLFLPWPMLALPAAGGLGLFDRFLGHRHRIEQTGGSYPWPGDRPAAPAVPVVSLNRDEAIDRRGLTRAREVAVALARGTKLVERTTRRELVEAFADRDLDDQLMYFWCHGDFQPVADQPPCLVVKLSDGMRIDAQLVRERRRGFGDHTPFQPFVLLNACHAGAPGGDGDHAHLGRALIEHGARGVLGPQIAMPQAFAAEYALAFVTRYLSGTETAGAIAHALARHFADAFRNPLGLAYALHCGMDARLERAPESP
ncbi:CHAT domain-containing protein [Streptomyces xanthochromogenes]|uniref:CHAT domain-containing protein n=1 Tax=Streptomyces xanthochromogenes TaxID=67384 RepID=UPI002F3F7A7D